MGPVIYEPKGRAGEYAGLACNIISGCDAKCRYCFGPLVGHTTQEEFHAPKLRKGLLDRMEKDAKKLAGDPRPVLLCFFTDPYCHAAAMWGMARAAIIILHESNLAAAILTKGGHRSMVDFDILRAPDEYAATLTFASESLSLEWEPRAAPPQERMDALLQAHKNGLKTWVSLEPIIDLDQTLGLIKLTHEYVDEYRIGKLNYLPSSLDWAEVLLAVVGRLMNLGKTYYIKNDLYAFAPEAMPQRWTPDNVCHVCGLQRSIKHEHVLDGGAWKSVLV